MSKVVNIGVIIRNEEGDTFPVALTPQMVSVIQNLLMQIPVMDSKLVDPSGKKLASKTSIPIIPRQIEFDWDAAYSPMEREKEMELMKKLSDKYAAMPETEKTDGVISQEIEGVEVTPNGTEEDGKVTPLHPERQEGAFTNPENPFNLELEASGTANEGMTEEEVKQANAEYDQRLIDEAKYPDPIAEKEKEEEQQDVTVEVPCLPISGKGHLPNSVE